MSGSVSGHGSGNDNTVYLYSSSEPGFASLPPAVIPSSWVSEYSAILPPADEFQKQHTETEGEEAHEGHHEEGFFQTVWHKIKHFFSILWNGPGGHHGESEHH